MTNRISVRDVAVSEGGSTSATVTIPATSAAGDLVLIGFTTAGYKPTTPTGWTLESEVTTGTPGAAGCVAVYVYSRVLVSGDPLSVTFTGLTADYWIAGAITLIGINSTFIDAAAATNITTPASQTYTLAGITTVTDDAWLVGFIGIDADSTIQRITGALTNATAVDEFNWIRRAYTVGTGGQLVVQTARVATPGASGNLTRTETTTASISVSVQLAIRPATSTEMRVAQLGTRMVRSVNPAEMRVAQLGVRMVRSTSVVLPPVQSKPTIVIAM